MKYDITEDGTWYHGSNKLFNLLETGSTITQWKELAEAFSHKPQMLCCCDNDDILHNGRETGYLYILIEPVKIDTDIMRHPRTTMDQNVEFLTKRPLQVKIIKKLSALSDGEIERANEEFIRLMSKK